jgi:hypothetical protein
LQSAALHSEALFAVLPLLGVALKEIRAASIGPV